MIANPNLSYAPIGQTSPVLSVGTPGLPFFTQPYAQAATQSPFHTQGQLTGSIPQCNLGISAMNPALVNPAVVHPNMVPSVVNPGVFQPAMHPAMINPAVGSAVPQYLQFVPGVGYVTPYGQIVNTPYLHSQLGVQQPWMQQPWATVPSTLGFQQPWLQQPWATVPNTLGFQQPWGVPAMQPVVGFNPAVAPTSVGQAVPLQNWIG